MPKITKRTVDAARPRDKEFFLWDDEIPGFFLRVYPTGKKTYGFQYRNRQNRTRRVVLGIHGRLTPDEARSEARQKLGEVERGADPSATRTADRHGPTVRELAKRYMDQHSRPRKKPSSIATDERLLDRLILPELGHLKVAAVTLADLYAWHHRHLETPTQANRALALASKMFSLAERWGLRPDGTNPCRHVDRYREKPRERFLSPAELGRLGDALAEVEAEAARTGGSSQCDLCGKEHTRRGFYCSNACSAKAWRQRPEATCTACGKRHRSGHDLCGACHGAQIHPSAILAVRLLALTGCRRSEILNLRWDEVDLDRKALILQDSKTGGKLVHLGPPALKLLAEATREEGSPYVCFGVKPGSRFVGIDKAWSLIRTRAKLPDLRLHDLRHSFASVGAAGGESLYVVGKLLGHKQPATTARYAHLADDPARAAADRISSTVAAHLAGGSGEVVDIEEARRRA